MALQTLDGGLIVPVGPGLLFTNTAPATQGVAIDAANEASIMIGQVVWSDLGSHTIDTTGSSSIGWRTAAVTFANAGTTFNVGIAPVDAATGPPARASNTTDVIANDVAAVLVGGAGGVTANAWQTSVPTTGTKTIATGDLVAITHQMTARAGVDSIIISHGATQATHQRPTLTQFTGAAYAATAASPNIILTASDGTVGYLHGSHIFSTLTTRTWSSVDATKEYGQLYKLPFPAKIIGLYGWLNPAANLDVVLYSDPLGTPVAEKTVAIDLNVASGANLRKFYVTFASPYTTAADQNIGAVFKPGASNISTNYRTLASATHRVADAYGTDGYGISRASGAFADANSSLDHYDIGLLVSAFDDGAGGAAPPTLLGQACM